ncbi:MAG: hypothetical protein KI792_09775 [Alphaproteobacteria bacterium]|nr:hypothetical protein [Alphaproteobacteria bacterium SS10]
MAVEFDQSATEKYTGKVNSAFAAIHPKIRQAMANDGWEFKAAGQFPYITDDYKEMFPGTRMTDVGVRVQEWEFVRGVTVGANSDFSPTKSVLLQEMVVSQRTGQRREAPNPGGVVRHEVGHVIDHLGDRLSLSEAFDKAYQQDMADHPDAEGLKKAFGDFIGDSRYHKKERFAELMGSAIGSGKETGGVKGTDLAEELPKTFELSRKVAKNLELGLAADHGIERGKQLEAADRGLDGVDYNGPGDGIVVDLDGWRAKRAAEASIAPDKPPEPDSRLPKLGGR